ncbi:PREDICTED: muscle-specific protein 20-like, partial [Acropora digitifera]|uniref:muscle-specific protein 20-like n=1 Tax=Acropora digitifera TaxID=70779 RepID=UPI00077A11B5
TKAKYNAEDEAQACQWIETVLGRDVFGGKTGEDAVHEILADGKVLVETIDTNLKLFQMENISKYLTFCGKQLGVPNGDQFQTVDLYEKQNMALVISQIHATGRRVRQYFHFFTESHALKERGRAIAKIKSSRE